MLINTNYVAWLTDIVTAGHSRNNRYSRLFYQLMNTPFRWSAGIPLDENRACDGHNLRRKFSKCSSEPTVTSNDGEPPATVLEVIVALAMRIEADIMHDSEYGDRTDTWFYCMLVSLGLKECDDTAYDKDYVNDVLERFMDRQYEPCGKGGLFTVDDPTVNMASIEIWQQAQIWLLHGVMNNE